MIQTTTAPEATTRASDNAAELKKAYQAMDPENATEFKIEAGNLKPTRTTMSQTNSLEANFHLFTSLPTELRIMIWEAGLPCEGHHLPVQLMWAKFEYLCPTCVLPTRFWRYCRHSSPNDKLEHFYRALAMTRGYFVLSPGSQSVIDDGKLSRISRICREAREVVLDQFPELLRVYQDGVGAVDDNPFWDPPQDIPKHKNFRWHPARDILTITQVVGSTSYRALWSNLGRYNYTHTFETEALGLYLEFSTPDRDVKFWDVVS